MILMEDIVREGHPALRKVAEEVTFPLETDEKKLCEDLLEYVINSQIDESMRTIWPSSRHRSCRSPSECLKKDLCAAYRRRRKKTAQHCRDKS